MSSKRSTWKNTRTFYAVIRFPRFSSKDIFLGEAKIQTYEFRNFNWVQWISGEFKRGSSGVQAGFKQGSSGVKAGFKRGTSGVQAGFKQGSSQVQAAMQYSKPVISWVISVYFSCIPVFVVRQIDPVKTDDTSACATFEVSQFTKLFDARNTGQLHT